MGYTSSTSPGRSMTFAETHVMELRQRFILQVLSSLVSQAELCRRSHISRKTGDKWIERFLEGDPRDVRSGPAISSTVIH